MQRCGILLLAMLFSAYTGIFGQIKRTSVPLGDAIDKALAKNSLTSEGARPFHIFLSVSEPENPESPYQGTMEEWWASPSEWRREVTTKSGMRQTIVVSNGKKTEKDEGDYFPLWLNKFVIAILDPVPDANAWKATHASIEQITLPNGDKSAACTRAESKIGSGAAAADAFSNVCFDGQGRVSFYGSPRYSMEFHEYHGFGKKQIARELVDNPEPGTKLVGSVTKLEELSKSNPPTLFAPLGAEDDRFRSVEVGSSQIEQLTASNPPIQWATVRSGKTQGRLAIYISIDASGHVREAWPLNSDNAGLDDSVRAQVMHWQAKIAMANGKPVQVDGPLSFAFDTKIADPLPVLHDAEVRALATKIVEPVWPKDATHGEVAELDIGVNEEGKLTGETYTKVPTNLQGAIMGAISQWKFRPLVRDGKPQYFHGVLEFVVP